MKHGWSIRLVGLVPASLVVSCLVAPTKDDLSPGDRSPSTSAEVQRGDLVSTASSTSEASGAKGAPAAPIEWADDCLALLRQLEQAGREARLTADDQPPMAVVLQSDARGWLDAPPPQPIDSDLPLEVHDGAPAAAVPCTLQIGPARDLTSAHRAIDLQDVNSVYRSGVRRERNPEYDVAQRRLRQAKHDAKGGQKVMTVGDPLLDLVGLAVGGVLSAFDGYGSRNEIAEATAALEATPRSREQPVYRAYNFERFVVRGQKEAVVPVALRDAAGRSLRTTELRQSELREFFMLRGLDPRDRDYEQHRATSMTRADLARWKRTPPVLRLSSVAAALVGGATPYPAPVVVPAGPPAAPGVPPLEPGVLAASAEGSVAEAGLTVEPVGPDWLDDADITADKSPARGGEARRVGFDLAELKTADLREGKRTQFDALRADLAEPGPHAASVVHIKAGARSGGGDGFYVRRDLVLTAYGVVREASVVDVTTADGATVPALVASVDPTNDLALVQVPRPGPAVELYSGEDPPLERTLAARTGEAGHPVFLGDQVVGMTTRPSAAGAGDIVAIGAIRAFLDDQASALPVLP